MPLILIARSGWPPRRCRPTSRHNQADAVVTCRVAPLASYCTLGLMRLGVLDAGDVEQPPLTAAQRRCQVSLSPGSCGCGRGTTELVQTADDTRQACRQIVAAAERKSFDHRW